MEKVQHRAHRVTFGDVGSSPTIQAMDVTVVLMSMYIVVGDVMGQCR